MVFPGDWKGKGFVTCRCCGSEVKHPPILMTKLGLVETCDCCGSALGEPEPVAVGYMKAMGVKTEAPRSVSCKQDV